MKKNKFPKGKNRKILQRERNKYQKAMQILSQKNNDYSYLKDNTIMIKIPIPNEKFEIKGVYNISKTKDRILIHISDDTTNEICGLTPMDLEHILEEEITSNEIENFNSAKTLDIENTEAIEAVIFNDTLESFENFKDIILSKAMRYHGILSQCRPSRLEELVYDEEQPNEAGGGVIIRP